MLNMSTAKYYSSVLILPDFAIILVRSCSYDILDIFTDCKEYIFASSSLKVELLVSAMKLKFFVKIFTHVIVN